VFSLKSLEQQKERQIGEFINQAESEIAGLRKKLQLAESQYVGFLRNQDHEELQKFGMINQEDFQTFITSSNSSSHFDRFVRRSNSLISSGFSSVQIEIGPKTCRTCCSWNVYSGKWLKDMRSILDGSSSFIENEAARYVDENMMIKVYSWSQNCTSCSSESFSSCTNFEKECFFLLNFPNIVRCYGFVDLSSEIPNITRSPVLELCLCNAKFILASFCSNESKQNSELTVSARDFLQILIDVSCALVYLHSYPPYGIVLGHFSLESVLIYRSSSKNRKFSAKVSDFCSSYFVSSPNQKNNHFSDVQLFGNFMLECLENLSSSQGTLKRNLLRPDIESNLKRLIHDCKTAPSRFIPMKDIFLQLSQLCVQLED
jgi:hypothetical protein